MARKAFLTEGRPHPTTPTCTSPQAEGGIKGATPNLGQAQRWAVGSVVEIRKPLCPHRCTGTQARQTTGSSSLPSSGGKVLPPYLLFLTTLAYSPQTPIEQAAHTVGLQWHTWERTLGEQRSNTTTQFQAPHTRPTFQVSPGQEQCVFMFSDWGERRSMSWMLHF